MSRLVCASIAGLGAVVAGCALPPWIGHRPGFPAGPGSWEIPLYQPLTEIGPKVIATVCGAPSAGKRPVCEEATFYVDSGASHSALPAATFARLGVETTGSRFATIEDAAGDRRGWSGGLVPEMRLGGGLALSNVVATVYEGGAILGSDVLIEHGWRIDLDRGTLVLGSEPASTSAVVARVPVRGLPARTIVDLGVEGRTVPLLLDTGAPFTVVDRSWLQALGLPLRPLAHGWPLSARDPRIRLSEATEALLRFGGVDLGRRPLVGYPPATGAESRGMLGTDVLSDFIYGVSNDALELVPRAPNALGTAPQRVTRWSDLPRCPDLPGCIAAQLEAAAEVAVRVRVAATAPGAHRYLFGCVDREGRLDNRPFWIEIGLRAPAAGQERVVDVGMPERLRQVWKVGCDRLALLDVNPVVASVRPMTAEVEARLVIGTRRARLD